eukprot:TRINITY_DN2713_c0_g1_i1.p1 TRINITY_DN2713_c0_g1~~TRINITY_DN2713_c0_g1_i1.p1  ORF type:complete len:190 (+),score=60.47 TRINITY_DN2713_c0_g1_i1:22-591(+)
MARRYIAMGVGVIAMAGIVGFGQSVFFPDAIQPDKRWSPQVIEAVEAKHKEKREQQEKEEMKKKLLDDSKSIHPSDITKELSKQHVFIYGADWCPHCKAQKALFAEAQAQFNNYVDCSGRKSGDLINEECMKKQFTALPTIENKDGKRVTGKLELAEIKQFLEFTEGTATKPPNESTASCKLPKPKKHE